MHIVVDHYTKVLRGATVLDDVCLTLEEGRIYGLKGKNGSGKTMLLRALCGLIRPTRGRVLIDGKALETGHFSPETGVLIESPSFVGSYTGFENLREISLIQHKISSQEVEDALEKVGLDPTDRRRVRTYSLGMRQRLGIACAIMEHPQLLLLDEPVNALDEEGVSRVRALLASERDRGATVVVACHDSAEIESLFDDTLLMSEGRVTRGVAK